MNQGAQMSFQLEIGLVVFIARPWQIHIDELFYAPRSARHYGNAVRQLDGLVDAMSHQYDGLWFPLPDSN
jgi:hypothetical protein